MNEALLRTEPTAEKTWKKLELTNNGKRYYGCAIVLNGELYQLGGVHNGFWTNHIYHYNTTTKTFDSKINIGNLTSFPVAFKVNESTIGFYSASSVWNWYRWTVGSTSVPVSSSDYMLSPANVISFDETVGGVKTTRNYLTNVNGTMDVYRVLGNAITKVGIGVLHGKQTAGCYANGKAYTFGGESGGVLNLASEYDIATNQAKALAPMPIPVRQSCAIVMNSDTIHVIGGSLNSSDMPTNSIQEYKISTNTWRVLDEKFPVAINYASYVQDSKAAYIVGNYMKDECEIYKYEF